MPRKVIIDCDPGIDDALALTLALFDSRLEISALTSVAGNVSAEQAARNLQVVLERLDPARHPRMGCGLPSEHGTDVDGRRLHGDDGLGNSDFSCSTLARQHAAEKVIAEEIRRFPNEVTLLCLGPLTNVARAFQRENALMEAIDRIVILGGAVNCVGDVSPTAEFNMYCDPESAHYVFQLPVTKTLLPLDVTSRVTFDHGLLNELPPETTRAGRFLRKILPPYFRGFRNSYGQESVHLGAAAAAVLLTNPELFDVTAMWGDVELTGKHTLGATVFDRRAFYRGPKNMTVARDLDTAAVTDCLLRGFIEAGRATAS